MRRKDDEGTIYKPITPVTSIAIVERATGYWIEETITKAFWQPGEVAGHSSISMARYSMRTERARLAAGWLSAFIP